MSTEPPVDPITDPLVQIQRQASLESLLLQKPSSASRSGAMEYLINHNLIRGSWVYRLLFRLAGIRIGKNVRFLGRVHVKIRGKAENVIIGNGVILGDNVDLRNRENGRIVLKERVYLDANVRIVAAREGSVEIDVGAELGNGTIINSGGVTRIGKFCMIAGHVGINASSHGTARNAYIKTQPHSHGRVEIGDDVWIGANASIIMDSVIGEGAIIGANAVVKGEFPPFAICAGVPARVIKFRE
jgi:acetyltransferase-like isoleucine patch superfamily enzyme